MDRPAPIQLYFAKIYEHLFSGRSVEYMLINPEIFCEGDVIGIFQEMNVIAECLIISRQIPKSPIIYELIPRKS